MRHECRMRVEWYNRIKNQWKFHHFSATSAWGQGNVCAQFFFIFFLRRWWIAFKNSSKPWLFSAHQFLYQEFILIWHKHFHDNESDENNIILLRAASEYWISELTFTDFFLIMWLNHVHLSSVQQQIYTVMFTV